MLLSMTGFGESHCQQAGLTVGVEVRAINSRYFKLSVRAGEGYGLLEPRVEEIVRQTIRRGTIQMNLRIDRCHSPDDFQINARVLSRYRTQLEALRMEWKLSADTPLENLLLLPGVIDDQSLTHFDPNEDWPIISEAVTGAMANLAHMREEEGRAMAADLRVNCQTIAVELTEIEQRLPFMMDGYRSRLQERLNKVLADYDVKLDPGDVIREVSLFADRGDISEEIVRLRSHLDQFDTIMQLPESSGRKLEFLTQEMFREANTIGSKANDIEIAKHVIEIKTAIERIREMIQNVE